MIVFLGVPVLAVFLMLKRGFKNLKANDVLKPKSILYFNECQRQPLFEEFFVEVIFNMLNFFSIWSSSKRNLDIVDCNGPILRSSSALVLGGKLIIYLASLKKVW